MSEERGTDETELDDADSDEDAVDTESDVRWEPAADGFGAWQLREVMGRWAGTPRARGPAPGVAYAEFGLRAVAFAIDLAILFLVMDWIGVLLNGPIARLASGSDGTFDPLLFSIIGVLVTGLALLTSGGIIVYSWRVLRASPGQLAVGLWTLRRGNGAEVDTLTAFTRWVLLFSPAILATGLPRAILSYFTFFDPSLSWLHDLLGLAPVLVVVWYVILGVTTLNDRQGRGLHDRIVGTVVIREVD